MNADLPRKAEECVKADRAGDVGMTRMRSAGPRTYIVTAAMFGLAVAYVYRGYRKLSACNVTIMDTSMGFRNTGILYLTRGCHESEPTPGGSAGR